MESIHNKTPVHLLLHGYNELLKIKSVLFNSMSNGFSLKIVRLLNDGLAIRFFTHSVPPIY